MTQMTDGFTYFSIYRAHAVYVNSDTGALYAYAAGRDGRITVFDHSFEAIMAQLDEICGAGG